MLHVVLLCSVLTASRQETKATDEDLAIKLKAYKQIDVLHQRKQMMYRRRIEIQKNSPKTVYVGFMAT